MSPSSAVRHGKVMFCLDNTGSLAQLYIEGHAALKGRAVFAPVNDEDDAAAFFKVNDPVADFDQIRRLVKSGFLVRTRADEATLNARKNDTARRDKALSSGAQFVSTGYPEPRKEWSDYCVRLPGNMVGRPNPVSAPTASTDEDLENHSSAKK